MSKGRSGIGDRNIQGTHDDWDGLSMNGRQYRNAVTQEIRNLSGAEYWNARKADYPSQETEVWKDGKANIAGFSDTVSKPKTKPKKSALQTVALADSHYERLANLSEELDKELESGKLSFDDWAYARKTLDVRLEKAWQRLSKARGWTNDNEPMLPYAEGFTLHLEAPKGLKIDYSMLPSDSVFSKLSDDNLFKIGYTICLTALSKVSRLWKVSKTVIQEGVI